MTPVEFRGNLWLQKTRVPGLLCGVVCVILRSAVLVELRLVTDGQTDRQTDRHTPMASTADAWRRAVNTSGQSESVLTCHYGRIAEARGLISRVPANNGMLLHVGLSVKNFQIREYFGKVTNKKVVVSCSLCAWPTHCWKTKRVHETTTFFLVTLLNVHGFKKPTDLAVSLS